MLSFFRFGYSLICNPTYETIRKQILNPDQDILPSCGVIKPLELPPSSNFIVVSHPKELIGLIVRFKLKVNGKEDIRFVLLPPPQKDIQQFYAHIKELETTDIAFKIRCGPISDEIDFVTQREIALEPYTIWSELLKERG